MNHTIRITVGSCSVEEVGHVDWSPATIERVIQALSKASIENGEKGAKAEVVTAIHNSPTCRDPECSPLYHQQDECLKLRPLKE